MSARRNKHRAALAASSAPVADPAQVDPSALSHVVSVEVTDAAGDVQSENWICTSVADAINSAMDALRAAMATADAGGEVSASVIGIEAGVPCFIAYYGALPEDAPEVEAQGDGAADTLPVLYGEVMQ